MRHLLRPLALSIVLCAAATFGSTPVSATDTPPPGTGSPPEIRWEPHRFEASSGETVDAELGTFAVPENRENPDSRSIELSFVRFPATTSEPGPPIVYLAGGPGGSGTGTARGARFPLFMALREIGDVLAFDQRGTGLSSSIPRCEPGGALPLDRPLDRETARQLIESEARRCAAFWSEQGVDLDGYDTAQSADDLEDLRRALGAEKLTLWGISYGTHLAFAALDRHPGSFDKAVLASAEGPDETVKLPLRTQAFLERADAELRAANPEAPALVSNLRRALERLSEAPATVSVAHPVTGDDVRLAIGKLEIQLIAGWMIKNPETLPALANLSAAMAAGSFEPVAPVVLRVRGMFDGLGGMAEAMDAASGMSAERRARVLAERDGSLLEDVLNFPDAARLGPRRLAGCRGAPRRLPGPTVR